MRWNAWRDYFESNKRQTYPDVTQGIGAIPKRWITPLRSTLARLQAGETGEGRIVNEVRKAGLQDADYHACMAMFVAEEGRHAAILGRAVKELGGKPLEASWTESTFRFARRMIGPRTKLLVLMSAEVIAISFYGALGDALPPGGLKDAFVAIGRDEEAHRDFHIDFFRSETQTAPKQALFLVAWVGAAGLSCAVVTADHWHTLRALDIDVPTMGRHMLDLITDTARQVLTPATEQELAVAA